VNIADIFMLSSKLPKQNEITFDDIFETSTKKKLLPLSD